MSNLDAALADHHAAVEEAVTTARAVPASLWTTPRATGKWSPAQGVEHLALSYEFNRRVLAGTAGKGLPRFLRPLLRRFIFVRILKAGRFTRKGRAPAVFQPSSSPAAPAEVIGRFIGAAEGFEAEVRSARPSTIEHPYFGEIATGDFLQLQAIHARHHRAQLPGVQPAGTST